MLGWRLVGDVTQETTRGQIIQKLKVRLRIFSSLKLTRSQRTDGYLIRKNGVLKNINGGRFHIVLNPRAGNEDRGVERLKFPDRLGFDLTLCFLRREIGDIGKM